ncbi:hypothetical protein [Curtobacterium sp. RRHDQ10]|uniref:hypothetical protein n=1 Tax=Curtobacterium phyllosphaerae TaxID=3413379 RepID=UPI003BF13EC7
MTPAPIVRTVRSADGTEIALSTSGAGPVLILVAGPFDDRGSDVQVGLTASLETSYSVTRYDRRGRGESGNTEPYAVAREVEDLRAVIDAVTSSDPTEAEAGSEAGAPLPADAGAAPAPGATTTPTAPSIADLVADLPEDATTPDDAGALDDPGTMDRLGRNASGSGTVRVLALCAGAGLVLHAMADGAPVDSAVLYEPSYRPGTRPGREGAENIVVLKDRIARGRRAAAVSYFLVEVLGMPRIAPFLLRLQPRTWRRLLAGAPTLPHDAMVMDGFALDHERFAGIDRPVLVVAGSNSTDWLKIAAQETVHAIRGSEHTVLQGQTHLVDPATLAEAAARFFGAARRT